MKQKVFENYKQSIEEIKQTGVKISRGNIVKDHKRFLEENREALSEGAREMKVLNMKRHFTRRGWAWPPKQHPILTVVHLINNYYQKEVCKHVPKDDLEQKLEKIGDNHLK